MMTTMTTTMTMTMMMPTKQARYAISSNGEVQLISNINIMGLIRQPWRI